MDGITTENISSPFDSRRSPAHHNLGALMPEGSCARDALRLIDGHSSYYLAPLSTQVGDETLIVHGS